MGRQADRDERDDHLSEQESLFARARRNRSVRAGDVDSRPIANIRPSSSHLATDAPAPPLPEAKLSRDHRREVQPHDAEPNELPTIRVSREKVDASPPPSSDQRQVERARTHAESQSKTHHDQGQRSRPRDTQTKRVRPSRPSQRDDDIAAMVAAARATTLEQDAPSNDGFLRRFGRGAAAFLLIGSLLGGGVYLLMQEGGLPFDRIAAELPFLGSTQTTSVAATSEPSTSADERITEIAGATRGFRQAQNSDLPSARSLAAPEVKSRAELTASATSVADTVRQIGPVTEVALTSASNEPAKLPEQLSAPATDEPVLFAGLEPRSPNGGTEVHASGPETGGQNPTPLAISSEHAPWVYIHYDSSIEAQFRRALDIAVELEERGFVIADLRPVDHDISLPRVRYYFEEDAGVSRDVASLLTTGAQSFEALAEVSLQKFDHFRPLPESGTIEIWLPSS